MKVNRRDFLKIGRRQGVAVALGGGSTDGANSLQSEKGLEPGVERWVPTVSANVWVGAVSW